MSCYKNLKLMPLNMLSNYSTCGTSQIMVANLENMALLKKFVIFLTVGVLLYCRDPLAVLKALASTVKPVCIVINIFKEIHEYVTLCPSCNTCVFFCDQSNHYYNGF